MALAVGHQASGTSARYIVMATVCARVLALPPRLAGMTPCSMTQNRSSVTPISRTRMIAGHPPGQVAEQGQPDEGDAR